ncbi:MULTISPECIES: YciI family protein [unclassified Lysobacter]|uniref:YciI family protein n=1 Tax=unclassified Lysobacter TaxID=2635362 RepID=UPI001C2285E6|nr:YciI family protein [Lysobacter sp. MMG2]MBU8977363.1 YciI family protein [Lysobacter sp. MMG2]
MKRYLVLARRTPGFDPAVIGPHHAYLDALRRQGRLELAGPFSDKSGGAYLLKAADLDEATELARTDPLHLSGASDVTVFEWNAA